MLRGRTSKPVVFSDNRASELPQYPGQLDTTLGTAPVFRTAVRGYDRIQVDSYVAWVEDELLTERRTLRAVVGQFRQTVGELERTRTRAEQSPEARQLLDVSAHAERLLTTAAEESAALLTNAADEADRVVTEAHREARARLESVRQLKQRVADWCDAERERVEADRAEARAEAARLLAEARAEAERLVEEGRRQRAEEDRAAEQERARAAEEASARLAAASSQLEVLQRQWHELVARIRTTDGLVARALSLLDRDDTVPGREAPGKPPVQRLPRSA